MHLHNELATALSHVQILRPTAQLRGGESDYPFCKILIFVQVGIVSARIAAPGDQQIPTIRLFKNTHIARHGRFTECEHKIAYRSDIEMV